MNDLQAKTCALKSLSLTLDEKETKIVKLTDNVLLGKILATKPFNRNVLAYIIKGS